ncbi:unnamed protein product [Albugo candida]|uniref:Uncharacterized protein n=1 Tax=Albugo candida TaxID=65357 RepID=A0A024GBQ2_9STRA|nr:unnamed protein product [Albugo candida]|eukprot:CCI43935.1 unnamed protein product [Albugo candida]
MTRSTIQKYKKFFMNRESSVPRTVSISIRNRVTARSCSNSVDCKFDGCPSANVARLRAESFIMLSNSGELFD